MVPVVRFPGVTTCAAIIRRRPTRGTVENDREIF